jgi:hypothetical protein
MAQNGRSDREGTDARMPRKKTVARSEATKAQRREAGNPEGERGPRPEDIAPEGTTPPAALDVPQPAYQEGTVDVVHADVGVGDDEADRTGHGQRRADAGGVDRGPAPSPDAFSSTEADARGTRPGRHGKTRS